MKAGVIWTVLRAYMAARWRMARWGNRAAIDRHQRRELARLLRDAARDLTYYNAYAGRAFDEWPVIDKAELLTHFSDMNRVGLSAETVHAALAKGRERLAGHLIGMSTGTSGNRGCYVITEQERFVWLGTILAKTLPDALWQRHRVALALPSLSDLYQSATRGSRIDLRFFDLAAGPESWADEFEAFAPDTTVAPPKVLRWLAERGQLGARNIFAGAEVLDPIDREVIEAATGHRVRQIYMATEGLFAVSCAHGTLHLCEDVVHFEFSRPDPDGALVSPIVTDFTRRAQGMIRYRMNDLLELDDAPCPCGSAFQAVKRVEGRSDDAFLLSDGAGAEQLVTPDIIRNAVVDADRAIRDYRVVQTGRAAIEVSLETALDAGVDERVKAALNAVLARRGLSATVKVTRGITTDFGRKLRRVSRAWRP